MGENTRPNYPLLALGGATGSGKTALAIKLAKRFPQLVILSADSRQVYRHLDIGTAKVGAPSTDASLTGQSEPVWVADGVPQYLIDIAEPNRDFALTDFTAHAQRLIRACWDSHRVPLIVGGTGLYIQALVEGYRPVGVANRQLRAGLANATLAQLQHRARLMGIQRNASDWRNPRRLVRAIERGHQTGVNQPLTTNAWVFVLERPWPEQSALAPGLVEERLELGLIDETKRLLEQGISKDWLKNTGLSYRLVIRLIDGEFSQADLPAFMTNEFRRLMKRQRTWYNRMPYAKRGNSATIADAIVGCLNRLTGDRQSPRRPPI